MRNIYIDDTSLFITGTTTEELSRTGNTTLKNLHAWSVNNPFVFNSEKAKAVVFQTTNAVHITPSLSLDSADILCVSDEKTLRLTFNEHLTWNVHIDS